jgi:kynurenine formamidase
VPDAEPTEQEIRALFQQVSNWDRWGADDERGTLNLTTADNRRRGLAAVRDGEPVGLGLVLDTVPSVINPSPAHMHVLMAGDTVAAEGFGQARDHIAMAPHGPVLTHLDALCHVFHDGRMYNGRPASMMKSTGAEANDVMVAGDGIVSRGVLLDIPAVRGAEYVDPTLAITLAELEEAEAMAGAELAAGDVALIRVGRHARRRVEGDSAERPGGKLTMAGLHPDCLTWLHERDIALLGSDAAHDVLPYGFAVPVPIHIGALVYMGLHLLDNAQFDELAAACQRRGSWEFLFVLAPLRIDRGTASPVNPIALL